jgi:two-component system OmpR family response regulator
MSGTRSERVRGTRAPGELVRGDRAGDDRVPGEHVLGDGTRVRGERDGGEYVRGDRPRGDRVRVLIVDDEPALTELLSVAVTEAGWRPYPVADGHSALRAARGCAPHAVVLEEVVLRLRGLLRRGGVEPLRADDSVLVLGDLVLSEETREVRRDGTPIQLTAKEFDLLGLLLGHPRQVLSKAQILDHVWSSSFDGGGNLVEVYISSVSDQLRDPMSDVVSGGRSVHCGGVA